MVQSYFYQSNLLINLIHFANESIENSTKRKSHYKVATFTELKKQDLTNVYLTPQKYEITLIKTIKPKTMKTIKILCTAILLFSLTANSQITKGNWIVGGNGSFSYSESKAHENVSSTKAYNINLAPNIGYFIFDKFSIGSKISFINSNFKSDQGDSKFNNTEIGPFARYYFLKIENSGNVFIEPSYTFNISKNSTKNSTMSFKVGYCYFLNSSVGFETSISYMLNKYENSPTNNTLLLGIGFQIHLEND